MERWTFQLPTIVDFGWAARSALPELAGRFAGPVVLASDAAVADLPAVREVIDAVSPAGVYAEITPNPTVDQVDALGELARTLGAAGVVAIGGGSAMDAAKAAAVLAASELKSIRDCHATDRALPTDHLPVIAVPTTAGTGSEVTPFAVLSDPQRGIKAPLAGEALYPARAVVDPELTLTQPAVVTAASALDALAHALEGYWSKQHQPICDLLAMEAAGLILKNLPRVYEQPDHAEARSALSRAALLAGAAFQLPKNAMVHACSFPLSQHHHLSHGAACALTLDFAILHNAPHTQGRLDRLADYCGCGGVEVLAARVRQHKRQGGLPCTLSEAGIDPADVPRLIDESFHPLMNNNPVEITRDDLQRMYDGLSL